MIASRHWTKSGVLGQWRNTSVHFPFPNRLSPRSVRSNRKCRLADLDEALKVYPVLFGVGYGGDDSRNLVVERVDAGVFALAFVPLDVDGARIVFRYEAH